MSRGSRAFWLPRQGHSADEYEDAGHVKGQEISEKTELAFFGGLCFSDGRFVWPWA